MSLNSIIFCIFKVPPAAESDSHAFCHALLNFQIKRACWHTVNNKNKQCS